MESGPISSSPSLFPVTPSKEVENSSALRSCCRQIQSKLQAIWKCISNCFCCCGSSLKERVSKDSPLVIEKRIQKLLQAIENLDEAYKKLKSQEFPQDPTSVAFKKQMEQCTEARKEWISSIKSAFSNAVKIIGSSKLDPEHLPKEIASQMTEILWRFGLMLYGNDQEAPHPFQSSLWILKAAILMQEYALGISESCPDFSKIESIEDLYQDELLRNQLSEKADAAIDRIDPETWAKKAKELTQKQLLLIPQILRYTNGAMRYLDHFKIEPLNLPRCDKLLDAAQACLIEARGDTRFDVKEVNNQLAELIYNDITGHVAKKARLCEEQSHNVEAQELWDILDGLWNTCVMLSSDPEKMVARCNNKRTFVRELSPEQDVELRQRAIVAHLALPAERQDQVLLALAWHNLARAYEKVGNIPEAFKAVAEALNMAIQAAARGTQDVQLGYIYKNAERMKAQYQLKYPDFTAAH